MPEEIEKLKARIRELEADLAEYKRYCGEDPNHSLKNWVFNVKQSLKGRGAAGTGAAFLVAAACAGPGLNSYHAVGLTLGACVYSKGGDLLGDQIKVRASQARRAMVAHGFESADIINHVGAGYQLSPRLYAWVLARKPEKKLEIL